MSVNRRLQPVEAIRRTIALSWGCWAVPQAETVARHAAVRRGFFHILSASARARAFVPM